MAAGDFDPTTRVRYLDEIEDSLTDAVEAVAEGMSYREVAAAIGLSHARVAQIVTSDPRGDA